jgi:hypothetical protein
MSYECSKTNVNDEMKQKVSSNLPVVRNEAVYHDAQPQVPKRDVELRKRPVVHTTARTKVQDNVKHRPRDVQGVELPHQRVTLVTHPATRRVAALKKIGESESSGVGVRDRRQDFEALIQNDLLALQANLHGPLDKTNHVSRMLDVIA